MLENLQNLVREHAGSAIINDPAIPNERNDEAIADAGSSIVSGLKSAVSNGNIDGLVDLFKKGGNEAATSPVTHNIQAGFVQNLIQKFGLDQGKASLITSAVIPMVMQKFVDKTNDPNDKGFDLQDIITNLTGGAGLKDIMNTTGQSEDKDGGVLGKIKGLFN
jgi:uncharacterized protein YidB (DUF937 family)